MNGLCSKNVSTFQRLILIIVSQMAKFGPIWSHCSWTVSRGSDFLFDDMILTQAFWGWGGFVFYREFSDTIPSMFDYR
jgi:hypothetical protein